MVQALNPDQEYPMYDVKIKCRGAFYPDIGILYPSVNKIVSIIDMSRAKDSSWYFIIWCNNTKNIETDLDVKRNNKSYLVYTMKNLNEQQIEFIPAWKKRADSLNKIKDTAIHHYQPAQNFIKRVVMS